MEKQAEPHNPRPGGGSTAATMFGHTRGAARSPVRFGTELPDTKERMRRAMAAYRFRYNASKEILSVERSYTHIYYDNYVKCHVYV